MCVDVTTLSRKYSIPVKKIIIIASMSGAIIEGDKVCGEIDERLVREYKEIEERLNNDEIVEVEDKRMIELFKEYNVIKAYGTLFITRRIPVMSSVLSRFPDIKRTAVLLGNTYYISPAQYLKLKLLLKKEQERVKTITIDLDEED